MLLSYKNFSHDLTDSKHTSSMSLSYYHVFFLVLCPHSSILGQNASFLNFGCFYSLLEGAGRLRKLLFDQVKEECLLMCSGSKVKWSEADKRAERQLHRNAGTLVSEQTDRQVGTKEGSHKYSK